MELLQDCFHTLPGAYGMDSRTSVTPAILLTHTDFSNTNLGTRVICTIYSTVLKTETTTSFIQHKI